MLVMTYMALCTVHTKATHFFKNFIPQTAQLEDNVHDSKIDLFVNAYCKLKHSTVIVDRKIFSNQKDFGSKVYSNSKLLVLVLTYS